jgi:hypothetical protein
LTTDLLRAFDDDLATFGEILTDCFFRTWSEPHESQVDRARRHALNGPIPVRR